MHRYLKAILPAALVLVLLNVSSPDTQGQVLREILQRIDKHHRSVTTLKGTVRINYLNAQLTECNLSEGFVNYLAPRSRNRMNVRIDWTKPAVEQLAIANGQYVFYRPRLKQAVVGKIGRTSDESLGVSDALFSLMGMSQAKLKTDYTVQYAGDEAIDQVNTFHIILKPRTTAAFKAADLWVTVDGMPVQTRVVEQNGDTTTIRLSNIVRNASVNASTFKIVPPKGTAIVRAGAFTSDFTGRFDKDKLRERVIRLSADEFEGRSPGTEAGKRAAQYIADEMKAAGVKPGNGRSYFQNVKLIGLKADANTQLQVGNDSYKFADDFVATTGAQKPEVAIDAELVFVGYGIDAPNFNWNDYSGRPEDYRGKVLMIMVNDPPATESEPKLFGDKALTYYGRWTYKYEEAARRGAAGVILIHSDDSAGYGWNVVRTSNGSWRYEILRGPGEKTPYLDLKSWVTNDTAKSILKGAKLDLDDLRDKARRRGFKPVRTGLRVKMNLKSEMQTSDSPNVVGIVEGSDPKLKNEYVVYTAHWDHLGVGAPDARGDRIYNGAYDNASGVATVLGIAEAFAKMPKKDRPKRSIFFLFPTAEEQGLLGAEYYSVHPLVPLAKTAANVNIDGVNFFGKTSDFSALGAERSSIEAVIDQAAKERNLTVEGDMRPEQGFFFRSDHFPFAKVGVPAISLRHGDNFVTPLKGEAESFFKEYTAKYYHQASDEYKEWWDTSAMIQEAELAMAIGVKLANLPAMPRYKDSDEFSAADKARFK